MMDTQLQSNEVRIPKTEFDLKSGIQCQYFQSSFARSLILNQTNYTRSLDIPLNFGGTSHAKDSTDKEISKLSDELSPEETNHDNGSSSSVEVTPLDVKNLWLNSQCISSRNAPDSSECEVLRLRKKCQNLIEENRRLLSQSHNGGTTSVETMILQNKIDTLKWQMQQVESSRQMYRALMESVAHFLERCHMSLDALQERESLNRSKSVLQMLPYELTEVPATYAPTRQRSSTNVSDIELHLSCQNLPRDIKASTDSIQTITSYSNFRDFTWRRTPKHTSSQNQISGSKMEADKLSQEAFRLLRNVKNLLNTQEPMLAQAKTAIDDFQIFRESSANDSNMNSMNLIFDRKLVTRESRSSLRSSSDSNSTASSKTDTDDDLPERIPSETCRNNLAKIEDESGFSSMSSFQEIGLPLISTPCSSSVSSDSTGSDSDPATSSHTKVGLPLTHFHRRWDSAPTVPPKKASLHNSRLHVDDERMHVLWV
ncbi:uncharacterized protein LOC129801744 isoform X2 [Phlebotomus papatasi]|uniref:uncharacterized protein LOC129801744 isoform X2 n=1 Tax=Phlebotomus papatasi TaxID=29031 RepID=UPI002483ADC1|nr:uncharacterized protein LOC129801744 isoform X2 [Phlebotomus papatasi]